MNDLKLKKAELIVQALAAIAARPDLFGKKADTLDQDWAIKKATEIVDDILKREGITTRDEDDYNF
jgi:hypothetical protein